MPDETTFERSGFALARTEDQSVISRASRTSARRVSPVAAYSGDGLLLQATADAQPPRWGPPFMPHTCRSQYPSGSAQLGGEQPSRVTLRHTPPLPHYPP
jgi:hypothetical protein